MAGPGPRVGRLTAETTTLQQSRRSGSVSVADLLRSTTHQVEDAAESPIRISLTRHQLSLQDQVLWVGGSPIGDCVVDGAAECLRRGLAARLDQSHPRCDLFILSCQSPGCALEHRP